MNRHPEVGDQVDDAGRTAIVTDIRKGTWYLRHPHGGPEWPVEDPERLRVTRTRTERTKT